MRRGTLYLKICFSANGIALNTFAESIRLQESKSANVSAAYPAISYRISSLLKTLSIFLLEGKAALLGKTSPNTALILAGRNSVSKCQLWCRCKHATCRGSAAPNTLVANIWPKSGWNQILPISYQPVLDVCHALFWISLEYGRMRLEQPFWSGRMGASKGRLNTCLTRRSMSAWSKNGLPVALVPDQGSRGTEMLPRMLVMSNFLPVALQ